RARRGRRSGRASSGARLRDSARNSRGPAPSTATRAERARRTRSAWREVFGETLPTFPVVPLQLRATEGELRRTEDDARLEHECKRVAEEARIEVRVAGLLERRRVGAV